MKKIVIWPDKLWVVSGPVCSGKTSTVGQWIRDKSAAGFLTPEVDGIRRFIDIQAKRMQTFQVDHGSNQPFISVGRFRLSTEVFKTGNELIENALTCNCDYFVIDEFGKLEMDGHGFRPAIDRLMSILPLEADSPVIIIIVRDYLLAEFLSLYQLSEWKS
ncbi:MAG: DUF2478 domain-containing protein [Saprospiraceae bacterium]|nr:DUF2478 domain-containing protein [Saprospiraceae bacterium]